MPTATPENITGNFTRLQNDRLEAIRLLDVFKVELQKVQGHKANFESEELEEIFLELADTVKGTTKTLTTWIEEFDVELVRVDDAIKGLASNDIEDVREAFSTFILDDTSLSVKNVSMMFYDLNSILESSKEYYED